MLRNFDDSSSNGSSVHTCVENCALIDKCIRSVPLTSAYQDDMCILAYKLNVMCTSVVA
jgi:hypothetical protein